MKATERAVLEAAIAWRAFRCELTEHTLRSAVDAYLASDPATTADYSPDLPTAQIRTSGSERRIHGGIDIDDDDD